MAVIPNAAIGDSAHGGISLFVFELSTAF